MFCGWKMRNVATFDWKLEVHRRFSFAIATLQLFSTSRKCKNFNFPIYTVPAEILISLKVFNEFSKSLFLADRWETWLILDWKFEVHIHFRFAIATLQRFHHPENVKISIFPITLSRQKCHYFKSIKRIFKTFFVA